METSQSTLGWVYSTISRETDLMRGFGIKLSLSCSLIWWGSLGASKVMVPARVFLFIKRSTSTWDNFIYMSDLYRVSVAPLRAGDFWLTRKNKLLLRLPLCMQIKNVWQVVAMLPARISLIHEFTYWRVCSPTLLKLLVYLHSNKYRLLRV